MKKTCTSLFLLLFLAWNLGAQTEADYIKALGQHLQGQTEHAVENGRVDILTATHAIEVEWATKWKNSIGQALWYSLQTNKKAGIILLLKEPKDYAQVIRLGSTLRYAGLGEQVKVWVYPNDFPGLQVAPPSVSPNADPSLTHWLNLNSQKRHNAKCTSNYGRTSNGRYCRADEGVACGICGG
ncbi:hypothetical protein QWY85_09990 [Neolewinella lacunae]|uniref:Uncharacterized protein n=1 Tax=Neolewinella lacunae TaxID=1517758 RepID=A0A923PII9_9BACT|nr:hypothetical protein [Neolewinella lacunae]MBC6993929.1 hypothetical protein [Neolewinella lacunae]MDN3634990.1 hypothetical protein [Neolewinella lacunae]